MRGEEGSGYCWKRTCCLIHQFSWYSTRNNKREGSWESIRLLKKTSTFSYSDFSTEHNDHVSCEMWASQAHPAVYFTSQVATDEVIYGTLMCSPALHGQHLDSAGQRWTAGSLYRYSDIHHLMPRPFDGYQASSGCGRDKWLQIWANLSSVNHYSLFHCKQESRSVKHFSILLLLLLNCVTVSCFLLLS